jgi:hypothetical protein
MRTFPRRCMYLPFNVEHCASFRFVDSHTHTLSNTHTHTESQACLPTPAAAADATSHVRRVTCGKAQVRRRCGKVVVPSDLRRRLGTGRGADARTVTGAESGADACGGQSEKVAVTRMFSIILLSRRPHMCALRLGWEEGRRARPVGAGLGRNGWVRCWWC